MKTSLSPHITFSSEAMSVCVYWNEYECEQMSAAKNFAFPPCLFVYFHCVRTLTSEDADLLKEEKKARHTFFFAVSDHPLSQLISYLWSLSYECQRPFYMLRSCLAWGQRHDFHGGKQTAESCASRPNGHTGRLIVRRTQRYRLHENNKSDLVVAEGFLQILSQLVGQLSAGCLLRAQPPDHT